MCVCCSIAVSRKMGEKKTYKVPVARRSGAVREEGRRGVRDVVIYYARVCGADGRPVRGTDGRTERESERERERARERESDRERERFGGDEGGTEREQINKMRNTNIRAGPKAAAGSGV